MECDGAIRNIEKEILRDCAASGIEVRPSFLNNYIKLLALDPSWGISISGAIQRSDVQKFVRYIVGQLRNQDTAAMVTMKMQFYFQCNYANRDRMARNNREQLMVRLKQLRTEVLETRALMDDDPEGVYKKIIWYITLASGMGNPLLEPIYKEARAALGSILDPKELAEFLELPKYLKEEQLDEFAELVTGIRLFNRDCAKGGFGIEDLPRLIHDAVDATNREVEIALIDTMQNVNLLTTAVDLIHVSDQDERERYTVSVNLPENVQDSDVEYVKDFLIIYRQLEVYLRKLLHASYKVDTRTDSLNADLEEGFDRLHQVVKHRIAIPVNEVFPLFKRLHEIWMQLQDQTVVLAQLNRMLKNIVLYVDDMKMDESIARMLLPAEQAIMTDADRLARNRHLVIPMENNHCRLFDLESLSDDTVLQYLGFCPVKLVKTGGALVPGNPNFGVLNHMNMNFAFSELQCGEVFGLTPEKYVMEVIELVRKKPQLIELLALKDQVELLQEFKDLVHEPPLLPITLSDETQTATHVVEEHIDPSYCWNVWDLRRRALLLANLSNKQSVSSQTLRSHHRTAAKNQTTEGRDKQLQTRRDNYSNVPKPSNFIFGLRGRKDDKQFVVELTRPVRE